jgi:hypothetical protein
LTDEATYEAEHEAIEQAQAEQEDYLAEIVLAAFLAWSATVKVEEIGSALDDTDANHIRRQLALTLDLNSDGIPKSVAAAITPANLRLESHAAAIATGAAAMVGHDLNTANAAMKGLRQSAGVFLDTFTRDTAQAFSSAIETAIYSPGDTIGRARQLRRSFGLSVLQADALDRMRDVLQQYHDTPREFVAAHTNASGKRVRAQYVRRANVAALLATTRGHLSGPQRKLLAGAISNPLLTAAQANALLNRHADALRKFRITAGVRRGLHELTETAKLAGWRIAQSVGALPNDQRRYWRTAGDERVRLAHAAVPILNPYGVPLKEPFKTPLGHRMHPPLEWGCRCRVHLKATAAK